MDVFNARDAEIVPELAQAVFQECSVKMDLDTSLVFNTGASNHQAAARFSAQTDKPCAMVGPFTDIPAQEMSIIATSEEIPLTVHRAFNHRVVNQDFSPFTSQIYPDLVASVGFLVEYLQYRERDNYIACLYALTDTGTQRSEGISLAMSEVSMIHEMVSYVSPAQSSFQGKTRTIQEAMKRVKLLGYRTIVLAMEMFNELDRIADSAAALDMLNGEYMWIVFGDAEPSVLYSQNPNVTSIMTGSTWLGPNEDHFLDPDNSSGLKAWFAQNSTAVDRLNAANPMQSGDVGYFLGPPDFFQTYDPDLGDGFMFDAVMATAMGACLAERGADNATVNGTAHLKGIRSVNFRGVSGQVILGPEADRPGARVASTVLWGVFNLLPPGGTDDVVVTELYVDEVWYELFDFYYADGSTSSPKLLRDVPEQNYLNRGIRAAGLTLMGVAMLAAVVSVVWVYRHREHRILRAAQPQFLYLLSFGALVSASTILVISFDESLGWSQDMLSSACMAIPWLLSLGHIITYGALFTKTWRVNEVLQFTRRKIDIRQVAWPSAILTVSALAVLSLWTGLKPMSWVRVELDEMTGESIGECDCQYLAGWLTPLVILMLIPTVLTAGMAWKTKDVDDAYSESKWIFTMIAVQIEVIFVSLPTMIVLREVSIDSRYLGFVFMLWTFPMSALGFIIVPKVVAFHQAIRGNGARRGKRGESVVGNIRVSGLNPPIPPGERNPDVLIAPYLKSSEKTEERAQKASSSPEPSHNAAADESGDETLEQAPHE